MSIITIISGSTLGSAESVAEHIATKLENKGFKINVLHGPDLRELPLKGIWIIVTSTYGAGDLPDNLQPLFDQLNHEKMDLSSVEFGAIGLGNRDYDIFCGAIKVFEQRLIQLGAKRLGERLEIDVLEYDLPEDAADDWLEHWETLLN